ncbi:NADPH:quinone reductase [Microbacterium invictum]|uniref:NADPH2:quinone reductase n=1 Tax=Microbacterium invictum TaxID=515415 RepID=A0AA40VMR2_9MICO|nr:MULTISPECIES: NADPH:quinone reductase [Microbacterium]MBB4140699.1 NADPH2:quinone reductase [Microbacterium invictum]
MRSIVYSSHGDSSVLSLVDREMPVPGPGEVRVRIAVSGVNPTDWKSRAATARLDQFAEIVPNQDGSGVVDAVGADVTELAVGDRVWLYLSQHGRPTGTAQEYTVVPAVRAVRLPPEVDLTTGATLGVPAITAHRALTVHEHGPSRLAPGTLTGRTVLVAGGAGAVGRAAIQLARWAGATVLTTVSSAEKATLARAAGAHTVIDYRTEDVIARVHEVAPDGVDHIIEVSIAANAGLDAEVAANSASIAYYADEGGTSFTMPTRPSFAKNLRIQGVLLYTVAPDAWAAAAEDITAALSSGILRTGEDVGLPLTWFSLDQAAAAHVAVEGGTIGKVLIRVADL